MGAPEPIVESRRPLVVAHRGASFDAAEHTLRAYEAAIDSGADAVECDVRLTRDGHLVCVHDRTVNRTSNGRGVVSELDLPTLDALDFSSWHDEPLRDSAYLDGVAADRIDQHGGVLTLEMLLGLVHDSNRRVRLLIETKHPTRYGGLVEKTLVSLLDRFGWAGRPGPPADIRHPPDPDARAFVMSFAPTAVRRIRLLAPDVPTVLLLDRLVAMISQRRGVNLPPGVTISGPGLSVLRADPAFVDRAHSRGIQVFVWTVDDPRDVRFVLDLGVDCIITDQPAQVRRLVDARY